jgi:hypothetical protein
MAQPIVPLLLFWSMTVLFFTLGGWQFHDYRNGKALEDRLEWRICNTTSYKIVKDFDGIVDVQTASCQWHNVPLFICHDASNPMLCLLENKNKILQSAWPCVCDKTDDCQVTPQTSWPDTKYETNKNGAIVMLSFGSFMAIGSIGITIIWCRHHYKQNSYTNIV